MLATGRGNRVFDRLYYVLVHFMVHINKVLFHRFQHQQLLYMFSQLFHSTDLDLLFIFSHWVEKYVRESIVYGLKFRNEDFDGFKRLEVH